MSGLEVTVLLGAAVFAGSALAPRLKVATPLVLVVLGLALGFIPVLREIELPPETVLLLFLPALLFWESLTTSLRSIRRDFRGIVIMSTLLVVVTAFAVAGVAHAFGIPWAAALVLGAAVAPPDATAVAALGRTLPHRNFQLLKAESLTNDGTALVVYAIAVGIAVGGSYTPWDITTMVALSYLGGLAVGITVAGLAHLALRQVREATLINIGLVLTPFVAYLAAELIGASGVLAVVVAGLVLSATSTRISTAASRRQTESAWPLGTGLLNGALFVLIGLEVQVVTRQLAGGEVLRLLGVVVAVWAALMVVRFVFQVASVTAIRTLDRRPSQQRRRMSHRARVVSAVAGFRGAVSLAIALSVPVVVADGSPFGGRDEVIFVTTGVILMTLLVQGPLLPAVVRWARLPADDAMTDELRLAERVLTQTALNAVYDVAGEHGISAEVTRRLVQDYTEHLNAQQAPQLDHDQSVGQVTRERSEAAQGAPGGTADTAGATGAAVSPSPTATAPPALQEAVSATAGASRPARAAQAQSTPWPLARGEEYTRLRVALLDRKREALIRLRREGTVDDSVARRIQTRLDIEELRLTGVDPLD